VAGLTAALCLAERGLQPLVLEGDPAYFGGRLSEKPAAAFAYPENQPAEVFPAEHGIHGFWSQYRNLKGILARHDIRPKFVQANRQEWVHGTEKRVKRAELGRVVRRTWWPAPFHYGALWFRPSFWRMVGWRDWLSIPAVLGSLVVAVGIDPLAEYKKMEGLTLADFCKGWPPAIRAFVASLARSGLSAHPEDVPLSGFIAFLRFYSLLRRDSQGFEYLAGDSGRAVIDPMVDRIRELGGQVRADCRVSHLDRLSGDNGGWVVHLADGSLRTASSVILACDATGTRRIMLDSPDTRELAANFHWPRGMETIVVRLWFAGQPHPKAEAGILSGNFAADNFFWLHRFQDRFQEWHRRTGQSALEAHVYGPPELISEPDKVILEKVTADFGRIYPALKDKVIHRTIQRNSATHTLFAIGTLAEHLGIRTPWPGLFCCGDWVRHPSPALFLERACLTGIEAANAVLLTRGQSPFPLEQHTRPELLSRLVGAYVRMMRSSIRGSR
jgi:isorenieratene synthase